MGLIIDKVVTGPFQVNTYLLADEDSREAWLVDVGGEERSVDDMVRRHGAKVVAVAATHAHVDHVAGAASACARYGVPFHMHEAEVPVLESLDVQCRTFGFPPVAPPRAGRLWRDGEEIAIGGERGTVILTPGHTPGGCCLYFEKSALLLTGDTLFSGSVGRTDFPGGDARALEVSVRDRLYPLPKDLFFYPGHGPRGRLEHERRANPFVRMPMAGEVTHEPV